MKSCNAKLTRRISNPPTNALCSIPLYPPLSLYSFTILSILILSINIFIASEYNNTTPYRTLQVIYRVTRRVFSKSVTSKLHILFKKILAGSLKTLKVTRISAMYTNFLHPPVHSGPSKFSRPKI